MAKKNEKEFNADDFEKNMTQAEYEALRYAIGKTNANVIKQGNKARKQATKQTAKPTAKKPSNTKKSRTI